MADEDGIGYFRDVWNIVNVSHSEALKTVRDEKVAVQALDAVAPDAQSFERLAALLDVHNPDFPSEEPEEQHDLEQLGRHVDIDSLDLGMLDVGVAGLSYALAAIGCLPAASCRGHIGDHVWARRPVVYAAVDKPHAEWLQPLVKQSSCGFDVDPVRPELLMLHAASIVDMNDLAAAVLAQAEAHPPPALRLSPSLEEDAKGEHSEIDGHEPTAN